MILRNDFFNLIEQFLIIFIAQLSRKDMPSNSSQGYP
jgi:hypothetical protein